MLILFLLVAAFHVSSSAPLANLHDDVFSLPVFGRDPPQSVNSVCNRTVRSTLLSCLATIFACTWIAVHPNVPGKSESRWQTFKTRVGIMIYALLAPEFITMWAMRQYIGAAKHVADYNHKFFPGVKPDSLAQNIKDWFRRPPTLTDGRWTLSHGFLLEMYGLRVDGDLVLGVDRLEKPVEVSNDEILDKSKGDCLTKLIVVLQTTWFIVKCLARWITHLPVTELEVVTLAFAVLNIVTYVLWWHKPQSMSLPIRAKTDDSVQFRQDWRMLVDKQKARNDIRNVEGAKEHAPLSQGRRNILDMLAHWVRGLVLSATLLAAGVVEGGKAIGQWAIHIFSDAHTSKQRVAQDSESIEEPIDDNYSDFRGEQDIFHVMGLNLLGWGKYIRMLLMPFAAVVDGTVDETGGLYSTFYSSQSAFENIEILVTTSIISMSFGRLHIIPIWITTSEFPSRFERLLWQICSLCIIAIPFLLLITRWTSTRLDLVKYCQLMIVFLTGWLYCLARFVLLVLAFLALRDFQTGAYQDVDWSGFIPHF